MRKYGIHSLLAATVCTSLLGLYGCGGTSGTVGAPSVAGFSGGDAGMPLARLASSPVFEPVAEEEAVPGEFIIKYRDDLMSMRVRDVQLFGAVPKKQLPSLKAQIVRLPEGLAVPEFQSRISQRPDIEYIEPNYIRHIFLTPNDPNFKSQWALSKISAPAAWDITPGSDRVTIALVDTGVDMTHPDLQAKIVKGHNIVADTDNAMDDNGHGTHTAGIAAAITNNGIGVAGVAAKVRIMPIKVMNAQGKGDDSTIAEGMIWAADHGADVINLSVGGPQSGKTLAMAVRYALSKNVVVVSAMGNEGRNQKNYPAGFPGVIAVGATDAQDRVANFSDFGSWISVSAPGVQILSTTPTYRVTLSNPIRNQQGQLVWAGLKQNYDILEGTSMAAPLVSGLCGLIRSKFPGLSPAQVKLRLEKSADASSSGFDPYYGHGRVNAARALS